MFSKTLSAVLRGIDSQIIQAEADVSRGLPYFELVGYLSGEVKEARERVKTAISNSGYMLDPRRIIVNLSPADIRKSGTSYDLAIACAVLCSYGFIPCSSLEDTLILGELSLSGSVRSINGVLSAVLMAREKKLRRCIVPEPNAFEGAAVEGIDVYGVSSLQQTLEFLKGNMNIKPVSAREVPSGADQEEVPDYADIHGQHLLKRSMEIAAAGLHNILIIGPPGSGKSMAAKRLPGILPPMSYEESLEVSKIYSAAGLLEPEKGLIAKRPFRSPHHTISALSLAGGGSNPMPGEISLAHRGVLFADELTEFSSESMEALRQPMEDGYITISRLRYTSTFPADFMFVAAMNPCRCGYYPDMTRCRCTPLQIQRYIGRISRPLLDRIDMTVEVKPVTVDLLQRGREADENSADMRQHVITADQMQARRFSDVGFEHNSQIPDREVSRFCRLNDECTEFMKKVYRTYALSARGYNKILRVARTIADLDQSENIEMKHISEAVFYKSLDKRYWLSS